MDIILGVWLLVAGRDGGLFEKLMKKRRKLDLVKLSMIHMISYATI